MPVRVTLQTLANNALYDTRKQTSLLARLQQQASTGNRLLAPSDDPAAAAALDNATAQDGRLGAYVDNIKSVRGTLDAGVSAMQEAGNILITARSLAIDASQSGGDQQTREAQATQIDRLLERLTSIANTQVNGDYLFAGTASRTQPFVVSATDANGRPTQITYQGSEDRPETITGQDQTVLPYLSGADVFTRPSASADPPGTLDAFQTLMSIRDTLRDPNVSDSQAAQTISSRLADIDRVHDRILQSVGSQSAALQGLDGLEQHVQDLQVTTQKAQSELGDVDLSEAIVKLQQQNMQMQLSFAGITRLFDQNLLDFLK